MTDTILHHGAFWTGNPAQPWAEAIWIRGDRILRVGANAEIAAAAPAGTPAVDLQGAFGLPGFIDSHTHFLQGGFTLSSVDLKGAKSRAEFVSKIGAFAKTLDKGTWILNGNWDHEQFDPPQLPTKEWIDKVTPDHPVFVRRYDLHMGLANSLALKMLGVTKDTEVPPGGEILRDPATGELTGILKEAAMEMFMNRIPEPSLKDNMRAVEAALRQAAEFGVTSIHDMTYISKSGPSFEAYQTLHQAGRLTSRLYVYFPITDIEVLTKMRLRTPFGNDYLRIAGLKGFIDGSIGSSTAYFFQPYSDNPQKFGLLTFQMEPAGLMEKRIEEADRAGLQVAIHAIGDRANAMILDIFERIKARHGDRDRRWRIEHAQHLRPADIGRFAPLGVIASVQPYHAIDDGRWIEKRIGPERSRTTYAFRSLLDQGARLALGSDWTVAPLNPLTGIYAAVTRATTDGKNPSGWHPEQKLSLEEALRGYTINGAYTEFAEKRKGSLEPGKLADIVVLDQNLFQIAPEKINDVRVKMTMVGGTVVYQK